MDYLKVPGYPEGWSNKLDTDPLHWFELKRSTTTLIDDEWRWLADLINAVYTPTTGLLAQLENQKRVIEELQNRLGYQQKLVEELRR